MQRIQKFFQSEASGGVLLLIFALMAIVFANTALSENYFHFLDTPVSVQFGAFSIAKPLLMWVNDGFMAVFFVLVGMEVKREMLEGSLSSYQQAIFRLGNSDGDRYRFCCRHCGTFRQARPFAAQSVFIGTCHY